MMKLVQILRSQFNVTLYFSLLAIASIAVAGGTGDYGGNGFGIFVPSASPNSRDEERIMTLDLWRFPINKPISDEIDLQAGTVNTNQEIEVNKILSHVWHKLKIDFPYLSYQLKQNYEKILIFTEGDFEFL